MSDAALRRLRDAGVENAVNELRWLREEQRGDAWLDAAVERRCAGEPLAYIVGWHEFHGLRFDLTPEVLIPRPETEGIVDCVLAAHATQPLRRAVDVGTGSGCIAISVAAKSEVHAILATDVSEAALVVARANAERHGVADRITFAAGDLLDPVRAAGWSGTVDCLAANLPYVAEEHAGSLARELGFEPRTALFAGPDGMAQLRRLAAGVCDALRPGGQLILEVGLNQAAATVDLLRETGCDSLRTHNDLAGIPRIVSGRRP